MTIDSSSIWHHMSDALFQSLYRVLSLLIAILPGILAFFVALVVLTVVGMIVSALLRRGLTWAKFDNRLTRYEVTTEWTLRHIRQQSWSRERRSGDASLLGLIIGVSAFDASYATGTTLPLTLLALSHSCRRSDPASGRRQSHCSFPRAKAVLIGAVNAQLQYAHGSSRLE